MCKLPLLTGAIIKRLKEDDYEKWSLIGWWNDDVILGNTFFKIHTFDFLLFLLSFHCLLQGLKSINLFMIDDIWLTCQGKYIQLYRRRNQYCLDKGCDFGCPL